MALPSQAAKGKDRSHVLLGRCTSSDPWGVVGDNAEGSLDKFDIFAVLIEPLLGCFLSGIVFWLCAVVWGVACQRTFQHVVGRRC